MSLKRPAQLDATIGVVSQWVVDLVNSGVITSGYLFGSAVNEDGKRFQALTSDIDLVVVVDWDSIAIMERIKRLQDLAQAKLKLEQELLLLFRRPHAGKAIVSLIPISVWERDQGVHKDGHSAIMDGTPVLDLTSSKIQGRISTEGVKRILPEPHRAVLQFVQKQRAAFLNISANGSRALEIKPHNDPAPKELLRNFAVATADANAEGPTQTDIARGLEELSSFVNKPERLEPEFRSFSEWLGVKRGARGEVDPIISETHYLIALEGIYDAIRVQYPSDTTVRVSRANVGEANNVRTPLKAQFTIGLSGKLVGRQSDIAFAVKTARANLEARAEPAFNVVFEEDEGAVELLADPAQRAPKLEEKRISAFRRRTQVQEQQQRLEDGFRLILWYGGTLFRAPEPDKIKAIVAALRSYVDHVQTGVLNIGGIWEAFHLSLYPNMPMAFSFSAQIEFDMGVRSVTETIPPGELAKSFVPELVSKYLYLCDTRGSEIYSPHADVIFDVGYWDFGPR